MIDLSPEAAAARGAIAVLDEQEEFAKILEGATLQSAADMIDFPTAASYEVAASEAVH